MGALLAVVLVTSYLLAGPMPPAGTPPVALAAFLRAHSDTQEWSWFLACGPALLLGPWFAGGLAVTLWHGNPRAHPLTAAGFASALLAGALLAEAGIFWGLFVYLGTQITSPSLILVLAEARHFSEGAVCFPAAGAALAYSFASRGVLPAWRPLLAIGVLASGLQLANGIDDFAADGVTGALGPASFAALMLWILGVSASLAWSGSAASEPLSAAAA